MENKIGLRKWLSFIVAGFVGQIAWALENMYLNVYAFYASGDYTFIRIMTAASAVAATVTTLFIGALSDKLKKRKAFICFGYILWGLSIGLFAFFDPKSSFNLIGNSMFLAGVMIVIMDCVMTFFGSSANDAAFNAYVTEEVDSSKRGKVESVLSILPMISMILIVVLAGVIVVDNKGWDIFFYVFGGLTTLAGIVCLFLFPKEESKERTNENYFKNIFYGFKPSVIKENPLLYITLLCFCIFSIAIQAFFPYFMVYIQNVLKITDLNFTITLGVVLLVSCIITVIFGLFIDKIGKNKLILPILGVGILGAILMIFAKDMIFVIIAGTILMCGYLISTAIFGAKIRDFTPKDKAGLFQGVRMIFAVMIPMVTGPYIGSAFFLINKTVYVNEYGMESLEPNSFMFIAVAILLALTIIPVIFLINKERKSNENL